MGIALDIMSFACRTRSGKVDPIFIVESLINLVTRVTQSSHVTRCASSASPTWAGVPGVARHLKASHTSMNEMHIHVQAL